MVHGVGDLPFFHPTKPVADKGQVYFFTGFTQGLNLCQSQRGVNAKSLVFQEQLASCLEHFIGGNRQNFGHECFGSGLC